MQRSEIITILIAVYGAVLSTIAILRQFFADRLKVKLTVSRNMQMVGDPRYNGMTLVLLQVTNIGRRPVTITTFGAIRLYPNTNFVAVDTRPPLPCEITEGKFITSIWDQQGVDFSTIDYWAVWDSHGRVYKLKEASWFKHMKSKVQQRSKVMSKNPRDWWARVLGVAGILIGASGLTLSYVNYRWQRAAYEENRTERVFARVSARINLSSVLFKKNRELQEGELAVEVVNIGNQPIYLKNVVGEVAGHRTTFYEHDALNTKEAMRRLEPGEAADYKTDLPMLWLENIAKKNESAIVKVETTKKRFSQSAQLDNVTVVSDVQTLQLIAPGVVTR